MDVKPPKTYTEQIETLRKHGCIIENEEQAKRFLYYVNYYRISGYFLPFKDEDGLFLPGTSLARVADIHDFDRKLSSVLFRAIGDMDIAVRSLIAYHHSQKYGALGYLSDENFYPTHSFYHSRIIKQFNTEVSRNSRVLFVKHHVKKYDGNFPLWVAIELFTSGMTSSFYSALLLDDQRSIAARLGTREKYLRSWLHCATVLRNICAHYGRLYYTHFNEIPKLTREYRQYEPNLLFAQLCMLKLMYQLHPMDWNSIVESIVALVDEYRPHLNFEHIGFPDDWETVLRW